MYLYSLINLTVVKNQRLININRRHIETFRFVDYTKYFAIIFFSIPRLR